MLKTAFRIIITINQSTMRCMNTLPNDKIFGLDKINSLPDMAILGSPNSTAKKGMMSKVWTNGDTVI